MARRIFLVAAIAFGCAFAVVQAGGARQTLPVTLNVEQFGSGQPLVALHGFGGSIYSWHAIRDVLAEHHTVYAVDLKGFGRSPKPHDGRYSVHDQAALILELIADRHLTNVTLLGHSFGGGVALAVAVELEERQPGVLSKLVLIDAASYRQRFPWFISALRMPIVGAFSQHLLPARAQVRSVLKFAYFNDRLITTEAIDAYADPLRQPGGRYALRETAKQIVPPDIDGLSSRYPHIKAPTLIIWGRHDRVVPIANGERLHAAIAGSQWFVVEQAGHMPHEETPDAIRGILSDFVR